MNPFRWRWYGVCGVLLILAACDNNPSGVAPTPTPPQVGAFQYAPDSINAAALPPDQVSDGTARVLIDMGVRAADADGAVARVVYTLAPASAPQAAISGPLQPAAGNRYEARLNVGVPATLNTQYTLRVYAIDNDSLVSNQVQGRIRFVPADAPEASP
ncbi:hypothetical protein [Salisaeta longa]|uniref:hypothetical protein n=1 Tax=Salisaeta longa TaxID=503170 RepID=UPI0003B2E3EF|nr:hypothetical protein [Salisaeta longa]